MTALFELKSLASAINFNFLYYEFNSRVPRKLFAEKSSCVSREFFSFQRQMNYVKLLKHTKRVNSFLYIVMRTSRQPRIEDV